MRSRVFLPELEGIRAYAFLIVFLVHYMTPSAIDPHVHTRTLRLWFLLIQISWVAVPVFFVLSGFLITGILYDTRNRAGFFSVFYRRRAIRILPLYYTVLAVFALLYLITHSRFVPQQLWFLIYLENLVHPPNSMWNNNLFTIAHLWSLAVEEQFYIVWPLVVWLLADRRKLLSACYGLIAVCFLVRFCWPLFHLQVEEAYFYTPTRCDAILLGAVLALHARAAHFDIRRLRWLAWALIAGSVIAVYTRVLLYGEALPFSYFGVSVLIPIINMLALGLVMLAMIPGSRLQRLCRAQWACRLGSMSYSLYLFHEIESPWVQLRLAPWLSDRVGHAPSRLLILAGAALVTYGAAWLTYRFVELPALRVKEKLRYGPERVAEPVAVARDSVTPAAAQAA